MEKENRIDRAFKIGNQIRKIASTDYMMLGDYKHSREIKCALAQDTHDLIRLIIEYKSEVFKDELF